MDSTSPAPGRFCKVHKHRNRSCHILFQSEPSFFLHLLQPLFSWRNSINIPDQDSDVAFSGPPPQLQGSLVSSREPGLWALLHSAVVQLHLIETVYILIFFFFFFIFKTVCSLRSEAGSFIDHLFIPRGPPYTWYHVGAKWMILESTRGKKPNSSLHWKLLVCSQWSNLWNIYDAKGCELRSGNIKRNESGALI